MILNGNLFAAVYWNDVAGGDSFYFHNTVFADVYRAKGIIMSFCSVCIEGQRYNYC